MRDSSSSNSSSTKVRERRSEPRISPSPRRRCNQSAVRASCVKAERAALRVSAYLLFSLQIHGKNDLSRGGCLDPLRESEREREETRRESEREGRKRGRSARGGASENAAALERERTRDLADSKRSRLFFPPPAFLTLLLPRTLQPVNLLESPLVRCKPQENSRIYLFYLFLS